jgi:hemerythrin-like domain-containing protein
MEVSAPPATPLGALSWEHLHIREVLRIIAAQLRRMETDGDMDFLLTANALSYMLAFPSRVHHPKEDAVFERLASRDPTCRDLVAQIRQQHLEIYEMERWLKAMALRRPLPISFEATRMVAFGREYLRLQREHIRTEEELLYPRARQVLTPEDWEQVASSVEAIDDPLSVEPPLETFQLLYDCIVRDASRASG